MTKFQTLLFASLLLCVLTAHGQRSHFRGSHSRSYADLVELTVREPGRLEQQMPADMIDRVRVLRVSGPLNDADVGFIAKLGKRSKVVDERGKGVDNYLDVDLERASVMERVGSRINHDVLPKRAFQYAGKLRSVVLPERLKEVGASAFESCYNLEEVVLSPRTVALGESAFSGCGSLRYLDLPDQLAEIGKRCFKDCKSLPVVLPAALRTLGEDALDGCAITTLRITAECEIENDSPGKMPQLQAVEVDSHNEVYSSVGGVLYDHGATSLLLYPQAKSGAYSIPDGVVRVAANAFANSQVTSVTFPSTLSQLGKASFAGCKRLQAIVIPGGVEQLPDNIFSGCTALASVRLGAITVLGKEAFSGCGALHAVTLTGTLNAISEKAFYQCTSLQTVTVPQSVTVIDQKAFSGCTALAALDGASSLTHIGKEAFRKCKSLTKFVLPSSVSVVDKEAFRECTSLREVVLNEGVLTIGDNALRETAIVKLVLPSTVKIVGKKVAEKCPALLRVECHATVPPELAGVSNEKLELYVPSASVEAYGKAKNWKKFKLVKPLRQQLPHMKSVAH